MGTDRRVEIALLPCFPAPLSGCTGPARFAKLKTVGSPAIKRHTVSYFVKLPKSPDYGVGSSVGASVGVGKSVGVGVSVGNGVLVGTGVSVGVGVPGTMTTK